MTGRETVLAAALYTVMGLWTQSTYYAQRHDCPPTYLQLALAGVAWPVAATVTLRSASCPADRRP